MGAASRVGYGLIIPFLAVTAAAGKGAGALLAIVALIAAANIFFSGDTDGRR
jgi:hypothetical protein